MTLVIKHNKKMVLVFIKYMYANVHLESWAYE